MLFFYSEKCWINGWKVRVKPLSQQELMAHTSKEEWHVSSGWTFSTGRWETTTPHILTDLSQQYTAYFVSTSHRTSSMRSKSEWDLIVGVSVTMSEVWRAYERKRSHPALRGVALGQSSICFEWRRKKQHVLSPSLFPCLLFLSYALSLNHHPSHHYVIYASHSKPL